MYSEQRRLEQILYERYPGAREVNGGNNTIRGINPANPNFGDYIEDAFAYLDRLGGG